MNSPATKDEKWQADLEDRFSKIDLVLQKVDKRFETKDIHDFRVEIKKLKALIRLFNSVATDSASCRFPKKLNKIYKQLGYLREWQIQRQKILSACGERNSPPPRSYINKIGRKTDLQKNKAVKLLDPLPQFDKNKKKIKSYLKSVISLEAKRSFIQKKMKNIHGLLVSGAYDDESMHYMRKMLKDVQYTLSGSEKESATKEGSARLKTIQTVSSQLGELHDLHIALILLNRELNTLKDKSREKTLLRKIRLSWQSDKEKIRKEALNYIKELDSATFPEPVPDLTI